MPGFAGQSVTVFSARSARFFKNFGVLAPGNPKNICPAEACEGDPWGRSHLLVPRGGAPGGPDSSAPLTYFEPRQV